MRRRSRRSRGPRRPPVVPTCRRASSIVLAGRARCWTPGASSARMKIIAESALAKSIAQRVAPDYVRFQQVDGVRVAHYVKHFVAGLDTERLDERVAGGVGSDTSAVPVTPGSNGATRAATPTRADGGGGEASADDRQPGGRAAEPTTASSHTARNAPTPAGAGTGAERAPEQATSEPTTQEPTAAVDIEDYVWTGTGWCARTSWSAISRPRSRLSHPRNAEDTER